METASLTMQGKQADTYEEYALQIRHIPSNHSILSMLGDQDSVGIIKSKTDPFIKWTWKCVVV